MSEHRPFNKQEAGQSRRRFEWVSLDAGDICIRELTVKETIALTERSSRPSIDPRGGVDPGEAVLWQILLSCYDGEGDDARPIFSDTEPADIRTIYGLRAEEFNRLLMAINRVNGQDATEADLLRDFTAARQGANSLP